MSERRDLPGRLAGVLRRGWDWYTDHNLAVNFLVMVTTSAVSVMAGVAPELLDRGGRVLGVVVTSDALHTFLLLALFFRIEMAGSDNRARTDGGDINPIQKTLGALLFAVGGSIVFSTFGDQWAIPGLFVGLTAYLLLSDE